MWESTKFCDAGTLEPQLRLSTHHTPPCPILSRLFAKGWETTNLNSRLSTLHLRKNEKPSNFHTHRIEARSAAASPDALTPMLFRDCFATYIAASAVFNNPSRSVASSG